MLTHEELIDLASNDSIRPLLLSRFPGASEEQLREAHAYAYGGSAIQDMGYDPFGNQLFSNLMHYARSGDFIAWLFRNAHTMDEFGLLSAPRRIIWETRLVIPRPSIPRPRWNSPNGDASSGRR